MSDKAPERVSAVQTGDELAPSEQVIEVGDDSTKQSRNEQETNETLEKRLRDSQVKITELAEATKALRDENNQLKGRFEQAGFNRTEETGRDNEQPPDDFKKDLDFFESEEFTGGAYEDVGVLQKGFKTQQRVFGQVLASRDQWLVNQLDAASKRIQELESRIELGTGNLGETVEQLKADPAYKGLDDKVIIQIAKNKMAGPDVTDTEVHAREFPGAGEFGSRAAAPPAKRSQQFEATRDRFYRKIFQPGE
jgi:DNA anti-recombination protein RmuC